MSNPLADCAGCCCPIHLFLKSALVKAPQTVHLPPGTSVYVRDTIRGYYGCLIPIDSQVLQMYSYVSSCGIRDCCGPLSGPHYQLFYEIRQRRNRIVTDCRENIFSVSLKHQEQV